jgi:coatomer protein complex subunit epsilon
MADSSDILFELRNYFLLGNYQGAINEGNNITPRNERERTDRDIYVYRSYIAQGNYQIVLDEIDDSAPAALQAVKLLATYLSSENNRDIALVTMKQWMSDGIAAGNHILQLVAGTIYYHEQNYEEALKCLHQSNSLEGLALLIQTLLKLDRPELAEKELKAMCQMDEDATITQLATAWVYMLMGGDKLQEAFFIFKEMADKYGATSALLNGQAVCNIYMKKFEEAERLLLEALEKHPKDPDTIINLVVCYLHLRKPQELVNRYVSQLKLSAPNHPWVTALKTAEDSFERSHVRYAL